MNILDVPSYRQKKDSFVCGAIAARMILAYYGIKATDQELNKKVRVYKNIGTFTPQWGLFFMGKGFVTEIITQNPKLFTRKDRGRNSAHLRRTLEERAKVLTSKIDKKAIESYLDYLNAGGKLTVRIPDENDIRDELQNKRPLLTELTSNWLVGVRRNFNFHFNVVTGFDGKLVYVNDPIWDRAGGKQKYPVQDFLFAMYAASHGDPDEGALMKIRRT